MPNRLPLTNARLSSSLVIQTYPLDSFDLTAQLFNVPSTQGKILSVITQFERKQDRDVFKRYELGDHAFEPLDVIPQKVKTTLTVQRIVLNSSDILQGLGINFSGSLVEQYLPFLIHEIRVSPLLQDGTPLTGTTIIEYLDCWLTTNPMKYDITSPDQVMLQDVTIECGQARMLPQGSAANTISTAIGVFTAAETALRVGQKLISKPISL